MSRATETILARGIRTTPRGLVIILADREVSVRWEDCSERLARATDEERQRAELSPGGYGIHWSLLDEDLTINGLVARAVA